MPRRSKAMAAFIFLVIAVWCAPIASAAPPAPQKPAPPAAVQKPAPPAAVKPAPASFHYNPAGKVDPFRPLVQKEQPMKKRSGRALSPLQNYDIEKLKLVGIVTDGKKKVAIVADPKGTTYVISRGTLIGPNDGKVMGVLDDQVIVEEKTADEKRKVKTKRIIMNLHRVEGKI